MTYLAADLSQVSLEELLLQGVGVGGKGPEVQTSACKGCEEAVQSVVLGKGQTKDSGSSSRGGSGGGASEEVLSQGSYVSSLTSSLSSGSLSRSEDPAGSASPSPASTRSHSPEPPRPVPCKPPAPAAEGGSPAVGYPAAAPAKEGVEKGSSSSSAAARFDPSARTLFVVEGLTYYLPDPAVAQLMAATSRLAAPGACTRVH